MSRTVVGFILLIVLLLGGILSGWSQKNYHEQVADLLEQAAREPLPDAWERALRARKIWERGWTLAAVFTDHAPLEQIGAGFSRLELFAQEGDSLSFRVLCTELACQVRALGDAHGVQWWNIL